MPTQLQLHLSVVALSLGKIFRFLTFLDVGYLSSAIEPTYGKGTMNRSRAGKYGYNSKVSNHSAHNHIKKKKKSISDHDSSKNLVPGDYGKTIIEADGGIPMGRMNGGPHGRTHNRGTVPGRQPNGNEIMVTTQYEIRSEIGARNGSQGDDIEAL